MRRGGVRCKAAAGARADAAHRPHRHQPYQYSAQVLYAQEMGFFTKAGAVGANAVDIGIATRAAAHAGLVARFQAAIREASAWSVANPAQCIDILARTLKQDPETISPDLLATFALRLTPANVQPEIAVTARYAKFPPFPAEDIIYTPRR